MNLSGNILTFAGRLLKIKAHKRKRVQDVEKLKLLNINSAAAMIRDNEIAMEEEAVAEIIVTMHQTI